MNEPKQANGNKPAAIDVKKLFSEYFSLDGKVQAAKKAVEELMAKRSDLVERIQKETGQTVFDVAGKGILKYRKRSTNKEDPNAPCTHYFATEGGEPLSIDLG